MVSYSDWEEQRRNWFPDPGTIKGDRYSSWNGGGTNAITLGSSHPEWAVSGTARRVTWTSISVPNSGDAGVIVADATDDEIFTVEYDVAISRDGSLGAPSAYDAVSGTVLTIDRSHSASQSLTAGTPQHRWLTFTRAPGASTSTRVIQTMAGKIDGDWIEIGNIIMYPGSKAEVGYFSGDTPPQNDLERYRWVGEPNASPSVYETRRVMATRASDQITLQVLPTPSYVRSYYLSQSSTLNPPAAPTTNPPTGAWTTVEPNYTAGSTNTLYTVQFTAWGDTTFEYGPVQKSSAYEAAKQAYNAAQAASGAATTALNTANGKNKVVFSTSDATGTTGYTAGDVWFKRSGALITGQWEFTTSWQARTLDTAVIGNLNAGKINAGFLDVANRIQASSIKTVKLDVDEIWASSAWLNVLRAGLIETSMLSPGVGSSLNISANGAVTTIINQQVDQSSQLAQTQSGVNEAAQAADDAAQAAADAQAGVNGVSGLVTTLAGQQAATAGQVATISTTFRVDSEGAHMGRSDSAFQTHIKPDAFEITENGVVTSRWEGGRMIVPSLETEEVVLVKHKFEAYGDGTVVRAIG